VFEDMGLKVAASFVQLWIIT